MFEMFNPFELRPKPKVASDVAAKNLLGGLGKELLRRTKKEGRIKLTSDVPEKIFPSDEERARAEVFLRVGEFFLDPLPGDRTPSEEEMRDQRAEGYRFSSVNFDHLYNLPYTELIITKGFLDELAISDPSLRKSLLELPQASEQRVVAKVIDIESVIEAKLGIDPDDDHLSHEEVIRYLDELGYRPATCKEFLAYTKTFWKPEEATLEGDGQKMANAAHLVSLGSKVRLDDKYLIASVWYEGGERYFILSPAPSGWGKRYRFLAVRK